MHKALRGLMSEVLSDVAENGLPGDHHFFITFDTTHPGVDMPPHLAERFPDEMTIVLQHEFWDLTVLPDRFAVTLSFSERPATLVVPMDAIKTFVDPSVEFGLRFDSTAESDDDEDEEEAPAARGHFAHEDDEEDAPDDDGGRKSGDVVSLDQFRK
jgi:hypothetical protein